jgi:hypothetical protein
MVKAKKNSSYLERRPVILDDSSPDPVPVILPYEPEIQLEPIQDENEEKDKVMLEVAINIFNTSLVLVKILFFK